jgi:hypothetical protein
MDTQCTGAKALFVVDVLALLLTAKRKSSDNHVRIVEVRHGVTDDGTWISI